MAFLTLGNEMGWKWNEMKRNGTRNRAYEITKPHRYVQSVSQSVNQSVGHIVSATREA